MRLQNDINCESVGPGETLVPRCMSWCGLGHGAFGSVRVEDPVAGDHAGADVVVDVAVEEPGSHVVRHHVRHHHAGRQEVHHVGPHAESGHRVAVPVRGVQVHLSAHAHQVPAHVLALLHGHGFNRLVAVHVAVDAVHHVALLEALVINLHGGGLAGELVDVAL